MTARRGRRLTRAVLVASVVVAVAAPAVGVAAARPPADAGRFDAWEATDTGGADGVAAGGPVGTGRSRGDGDGPPGPRQRHVPAPTVPRTDASFAATGSRDAAAGPRPTRLLIPSVGVDARVVATGVRRDGRAEIPDDARRVGWYRHGPEPGAAEGAAVLVGHRDSRAQGPGALYPMDRVEVGDAIRVVRGDGSQAAYTVVERRRWGKDEVPLERLYSRTGPPRLVVITCGGAYDAARGGYQDNLVVTAVPAGSR